MKKFVFIYYIGSGQPKQGEDVMQRWTSWFESLGEKLVDGGNPFGSGKAVEKDKVSDIAPESWPAMGYSIVNANDFDEATELAKGCPILEDSDDAAVRVFECMDM